MSSLWTAFKNLFARKTADTDSSKEKANGQKENQRVQRKHMYDEIDIKENDQAAIRVHPYDSIDVDEGKVTVKAGSSETIRVHPYDSIDVDEGKVTVKAGSSEIRESATGQLEQLQRFLKGDKNPYLHIVLNSDKLNYVELDFGEKGTKKENKEKSDKPILIIGAGSSVDYTEIQIQH